MEIINVTATATKQGTNPGRRESKSEKEARIRTEFWGNARNTSFISVGHLLATTKVNGQPIANLIAQGQVWRPTEVSIEGFTFPLLPGFEVSIETMRSHWACPMCKSAHGSGVGVSTDVKSKGLAINRWFYNPATLELFVISNTCFDDYVKGLAMTSRAMGWPTEGALNLANAVYKGLTTAPEQSTAPEVIADTTDVDLDALEANDSAQGLTAEELATVTVPAPEVTAPEVTVTAPMFGRKSKR